jgi:hypothetical protein
MKVEEEIMLIDFTEIEFQGGFDFERFVEDLLNALGWTILVRPGPGPDGGRDIIASKKEEFATGRVIDRKYVVQCKHNAHSNNIVKPRDLTDFIIMPEKHSTQGWFLVTSTNVSEDAKNNIIAANNTCKGTIFDFWDARDIEEKLTKDERCRDVLKRYFPISYSIATHIIIPSMAEIDEILLKWTNHYKEYGHNFFINPDHKNAIYSMVIFNELTISKLQSLLFIDSNISDFMKIWDIKLKRKNVAAEIGILLFGLIRLGELKSKGLHNDSIEEILCSEIESVATYRNMLRRHWNEFLVFKGKDYDWTLFYINYENAYICPFLSCGFRLIIYCEKYGDVAKGALKILGDNREYKFIASYKSETVFDYLSKNPLNLPISIEYKLDEGSDAVLFISAGYAQIHGTDGKNFMNYSWNILV